MNLLLNFLLTIGIVLSLVFIGVLLKQKQDIYPKIFLSCIFFLLFNVVLHTYSEVNSVTPLFNFTYLFADTIGFLLGPLLFLYIKSLFLKRKLHFPKVMYHFIPAVIYLIVVSLPSLISMMHNSYVFDYLKFIDTYQFILQIQALYLIWYIVKSLILLKQIKTMSKESFSNLSGKDLDWITYFLYGILGVILVNILIEVYSTFVNGHLSIDNTLTTISLIAVIIYLGYFGISQSQILLPEFIKNQIKFETETNVLTGNSNHHLANASDTEIEHLKNSLISLLESKKPYLDENLNLKTLADMIPTTDRKLSALLNHYLDTNFYDFINAYRVKEIQYKMVQKDYNKFTMLALALDSGFNSKSSFNRIFKKETGMSPSAYKKLHIHNRI